MAGFKLRMTSGDDTGRDFVFAQKVVRIGRVPDNDLVLYDTGVSRHHCEIINDGDGFVLRDVGSANGTMLNGVLTTEASVKEGDEITVCATRFLFTRSEGHSLSDDRSKAVRRPEDLDERRRLEEVHTGAYNPDGSDLIPPPRRHPVIERWRRIPGSQKTILGGAMAFAVIAIALTWASVGLQRPTDRSRNIFSMDSQTIARTFGSGKVEVYTPDRVNFQFDYGGGKVVLSYSAGGIESDRELQILVNNRSLAFVPVARTWRQGFEVPISEDLLLSGINIVTFDNTLTDLNDHRERWGVSAVQIRQHVAQKADPQKARELINLAKQAYETRSVAPHNLFRAINYYRQALTMLEEKPVQGVPVDEVREHLARAEQELIKIHSGYVFSAQKALRFGERSTALDTLKELLRYYPDPAHHRHQEVLGQIKAMASDGSGATDQQ